MKKRKILTLDQKIKVIETSEKEGLSCREIAEKFGVGKTQVSRILSERSEVRKESNTNIERKILKRTSEYEEVNSLTLEWFHKARSLGIPVSGPVIKQKALMFASLTGKESFIASNGWLEKFNKRANITFKLISGEAKDVCPITVNQWKKNIKEICDDYSPEDIFNADESGLFWKGLPKRTFDYAGEETTGLKVHKNRISIMFVTNLNGTEKRKLLVIGKGAKPHCYGRGTVAHYHQGKLIYKHNKKAWMTSQIFEEYLLHWNSQLQFQERRILLFIDNAGCHPSKTLTNIKIQFFPPNTTSVLQPLDQGIIRVFKSLYRKKFISRLLSMIEEEQDVKEVMKMITFRHALQWSIESWDEINSSTIKNCWKKAGFEDIGESPQYDVMSPESVLSPVFESPLIHSTLEELTNYDESLETCEPISPDFEKEMCERLTQKYNTPITENIIESEESETEYVPESDLNWKNVSQMLFKLESFFSSKDPELATKIQTIHTLSDKLKLATVVQQTLPQFWVTTQNI